MAPRGGVGHGADTSVRQWRWIETDPWGHRVHCAEDVWQVKVGRHGEIASHEDAIRSTICDPDGLFFDAASTEAREQMAFYRQPRLWIVTYMSLGRTHGRYEGKFVRVVARWELPRGHTGPPVGYVHTMLLTDAITPRLQLLWERYP